MKYHSQSLFKWVSIVLLLSVVITSLLFWQKGFGSLFSTTEHNSGSLSLNTPNAKKPVVKSENDSCDVTLSPKDSLQSALNSSESKTTICLTKGLFTWNEPVVVPEDKEFQITGVFDSKNPQDPSSSTVVQISLDNHESPGITVPMNTDIEEISFQVRKASSAIKLNHQDSDSSSSGALTLISCHFEAKEDACEYLVDFYSNGSKPKNNHVNIFECSFKGTNINHIYRTNLNTHFYRTGFFPNVQVEHIVNDHRNASITSTLKIQGGEITFGYPIIGSVSNPGPLFYLGSNAKQLNIPKGTISQASLVYQVEESSSVSIEAASTSYLYVKEIIRGTPQKFNAYSSCFASCETMASDSRFLTTLSNASSSWWGDVHGPSPPGFGTHFSGDRALVKPWLSTIPQFCDDEVSKQLSVNQNYLNLDESDLEFFVDDSVMSRQAYVQAQIWIESLQIKEKSGVIPFDSGIKGYVWKAIVEKLLSQYGKEQLNGVKADFVVTPHDSAFSFANIARNILVSSELEIKITESIESPFYLTEHDSLPIHWNSTGYMPHINVMLYSKSIVSSSEQSASLVSNQKVVNKGEFQIDKHILSSAREYFIRIQDSSNSLIHQHSNSFLVVNSPPSSSSSSSAPFSSSESNNSESDSSIGFNSNDTSNIALKFSSILLSFNLFVLLVNLIY